MTTPTDLREQAAAASAELRGPDMPIRLAQLTEIATLIDQLASALPVWRFDMENAPRDRVIGWCVYPAGAEARIVTSRGGHWWAYGLTQTVVAWMPLPQSEPVPEEKEKA